MSNEYKLKPCPFCGSEAVINIRHFAICTGCDASTAFFGSDKEAVEAWNTRAEHDINEAVYEAYQELQASVGILGQCLNIGEV